MNCKRVLILGVARSGSSWLARIVCAVDQDCIYQHEPDSHFLYAAAAFAKRECGQFYSNIPDNAPALVKLWSDVFFINNTSRDRSSHIRQKIWSYVPGLWKDHAVLCKRKHFVDEQRRRYQIVVIGNTILLIKLI